MKIKNFFKKHSVAIGACVIMALICLLSWYVVGQGGGETLTSIGQNMGVVGNLTVGGNVGIGTMEPQAKVDTSGGLHVRGVQYATSGSVVEIQKPSASLGTISMIADGSTRGFGEMRVYGSSVGLWPNGSAVLTATSGGNVGIGTTNPGAKLDVDGYIKSTVPAFSARGVTQTFSSSGGKDLAYTTTGGRSFNVGGHFNNTTSKFTAPVTGIYYFFANCRFDGADVDYFRLYFNVNDATGIDYSLPHSIADFGTNWKPRYATQTIAGAIWLNEGDTIKVVAHGHTDTSWQHQGEDTFSGYLIVAQ